MAQITGIFKAWLNTIFQLQLAFMIDTSSRKILLTSSNPRRKLKRDTSGQKARKKSYRSKIQIFNKNFYPCSSSMYESKGNLLLNPINQFFSSTHLNSSPINSPQSEILCRLSRKKELFMVAFQY